MNPNRKSAAVLECLDRMKGVIDNPPQFESPMQAVMHMSSVLANAERLKQIVKTRVDYRDVVDVTEGMG